MQLDQQLQNASKLMAAKPMQGFSLTDFEGRYGESDSVLAAMLRNGSLSMRTTVYDGWELAPEAMIGLLHGANLGKTVVKL